MPLYGNQYLTQAIHPDSQHWGAQRQSTWTEILQESPLPIEHRGLCVPVWSFKATRSGETFYVVQNMELRWLS
jgi:hypothetical protein